MTGLKQIENQRAFERAQIEAKEEPAYQLLQEIYGLGLVDEFPGLADLNKRVQVYLTTGILLQKQ
jgi:hypothetical protein